MWKYAIAVTSALLFLARDAVAVPAPMDPSELMAKADLVIEAEVVEVTCSGEPQRGDGVVTSNYLSKVRTLKALKGSPPADVSVTGESQEWTDPDKQPAGYPPHAPLPKGWSGTLYLKGASSPYGLVWYNGAVENTSASKPTGLPECKKRGCAGCTLASRSGDAPIVLLGLAAGLFGARSRARRRAVHADVAPLGDRRRQPV